MINILSNAVKFSPDDSTVQVDVRRDDRHVDIEVKDQGIGIRREFLPNTMAAPSVPTAPAKDTAQRSRCGCRFRRRRK